MRELPEAIRDDFERAKRLEWWTLVWMGSVVVVMYLAMGASQAMKTAFLEDLLGLIPACTFLAAAHLETREPTRKFPYGFLRANSLAFVASAVVLAFLGLYLIYGNATGLMNGEHPTIGPVTLFGETFWLGWVMIAALAYSVIPPVVLGRLKQPVARRLRDKVLHTDALMQKADWQTGLAGLAGVLGIGFGLWWADSLAALLIALSILKDGINATRQASAELLDGAPRSLETSDVSDEARQIEDSIARRWPGASVRLRESGRYIFAAVDGVEASDDIPRAEDLTGDGPAWRLARLTFGPRRPGKDSHSPRNEGD